MPFAAALDVPEARTAVEAASRDQPAVRAEGDSFNRTGMGQVGDALPGGDVPHLCRLRGRRSFQDPRGERAARADGDPLPIGAECDRVDDVALWQARLLPTVGERYEPDKAVEAAGCQQSGVGAEA